MQETAFEQPEPQGSALQVRGLRHATSGSTEAILTDVWRMLGVCVTPCPAVTLVHTSRQRHSRPLCRKLLGTRQASARVAHCAWGPRPSPCGRPCPCPPPLPNLSMPMHTPVVTVLAPVPVPVPGLKVGESCCKNCSEDSLYICVYSSNASTRCLPKPPDLKGPPLLFMTTRVFAMQPQLMDIMTCAAAHATHSRTPRQHGAVHVLALKGRGTGKTIQVKG